MFKACRHSVIFLRNRDFILRQNIHWPTFVSSFSAVYRVSIPGDIPVDHFCFFKLQDMDCSSI